MGTITSSRTFGIELEMGVNSPDSIRTLRKKYGGDWQFHDDGSIRNIVPNPVELVSPILRGSAGEDAVKKVCSSLKELGFSGNNLACGFHVHLGLEEAKPRHSYVVMTKRELELFLSSPSNRKKILGACHIPKEIVCCANSVKTANNTQYREMGKRLIDKGSPLWWDGKLVISLAEIKEKIAGYVINYTGMFYCGRDEYYNVDRAFTTEVKRLEDKLAQVSPIPADVRRQFERDYEIAKKKCNDAQRALFKSSVGKFVIKVTDNHGVVELINLLLFYVVFDRVFLSMLPRNRREGNTFCVPLEDSFDVEEITKCNTIEDFQKVWYKEPEGARRRIENHYDDSRYHDINFHSLFNRHGTVEIRSHGGTVDAGKILLWTALHQAVVDKVMDGTIGREDILKFNGANTRDLAVGMINLLGVGAKLRKYIERLLKFYSNIDI